MKKRAPALPDALYRSVMASSSDVCRMSEITADILDADGKTVYLTAGTRLLQLRKTETAVAKYHVRPEISEHIKRLLPLPLHGGILAYFEHVQKRPTWLHLYGPPGVGKTSLSVSEAETITPLPAHTHTISQSILEIGKE